MKTLFSTNSNVEWLLTKSMSIKLNINKGFHIESLCKFALHWDKSKAINRNFLYTRVHIAKVEDYREQKDHEALEQGWVKKSGGERVKKGW